MINDTHDESIKMIFANPTITESQISWEQKQAARKQKLQCSKKTEDPKSKQKHRHLQPKDNEKKT